MKNYCILLCMLISLPTLQAGKKELHQNIEKIVKYSQLRDKEENIDKNIIVQPVISLLISKKNDEFNSWLSDENTKNRAKYIPQGDHYADISQDINVILLLKHVAKIYNKDVLEPIHNVYKERYETESVIYNLLSKVHNNDFATEYTYSKKQVMNSFKKYVEKLVKDISE